MHSNISSVERWLDHRKDIGILLLRIFVGVRLFYGVIDNIVSWDRMIEFSAFLQSQGVPAPVFAAILSAYSQFIGSLCIFFGYKIRVASFVLIINFLVAMIVHLRLNDSFEAMTPPLAMLFSCLTFVFTGAGKLRIFKKRINVGRFNAGLVQVRDVVKVMERKAVVSLIANRKRFLFSTQFYSNSSHPVGRHLNRNNEVACPDHTTLNHACSNTSQAAHCIVSTFAKIFFHSRTGMTIA